MANFSFRNLKKQTPKRIKRLGNAIFAGAQAAALLALVGDIKELAIGLTIAGFLGKFLSELFADDDKPNNPS